MAALSRNQKALLFLSHAIASVCFVTLAVADEPADEPEYMPVIRQELARLDIQALCDDSLQSCRYSQTITDAAREFEIIIRYSKATDTVYICIENFIPLEDQAPSEELARRLLELNREMVSAKFEWDKSQSRIRLSTTINTDSNFDRRAFRSQLIGIWSIARRVWPKLSPLLPKSQK